MTEYIDRDVVIGEIVAKPDLTCDQKVALVGMIQLLPEKTIRYGHWKKVGGYCTPGGDPVWRCSECGKGQHVYGIEYSSYSGDVSDGQWVACPNCGAEMRRDANV